MYVCSEITMIKKNNQSAIALNKKYGTHGKKSF